jgi:Trk K+ transport system NAD-binding subunit
VLGAIAERVGASAREIEQSALASEYARPDAETHAHTPSTPLDGYEVVEIVIGPHSPVLGQRLDEIPWPPRTIAAAVTEGLEIVAPRPDLKLRVGERVVLLAPAVHAHDTEALTPT